MKYIALAIIVAVTFGVCFLLDKGFSRLFRSRAQHRSGMAVRLNKRYASFGLLLTVVGIGAVIVGFSGEWLLGVGGLLVLLAGAAMVVYYLSFGVYYDKEGMLVSTFGKKSSTHSFRDIQGQKLYVLQGGQMLIELHMADGKTVSIQSAMEGACPFLDHAFAAWCVQTGRDPENCGFHDPVKWQWFPNVDQEEG